MNKTKNILLFGMIFFLYACNGDAKKNHKKILQLFRSNI